MKPVRFEVNSRRLFIPGLFPIVFSRVFKIPRELETELLRVRRVRRVTVTKQMAYVILRLDVVVNSDSNWVCYIRCEAI